MLHTGDRQTCLTAVPEMASKYAQWGFAEDYLVTFSELQLGHLDAVEVPEGMALVDLRTVDFKVRLLGHLCLASRCYLRSRTVVSTNSRSG